MNYAKYSEHSFYLIFTVSAFPRQFVWSSLNQEATITINPRNDIQRVEGSPREENTACYNNIRS